MIRDVEQRWLRVERREPDPQDLFVYGVTTTRIYCQVGCPSPLPRRENIRFFESPLQAEAAGFRPCKRCHPDRVTGSPHEQEIRRACKLIEDAEEEPALAELAIEAGLSKGHFQRIFKRVVGLSPKQYAIAVRKRRLTENLPGARSVTDAIYASGYSTNSRAYEASEDFGMAPGAYRNGGAGELICYAFAETDLGLVLIASTQKGICMIEFGEEAALLDLLRSRFPSAQIEPGSESLTETVERVIQDIEDPGERAALPLDIRGTVFQEKVWRALTEIKVGETLSYTELAERIRHPRSVRAVANACAKNPVALRVPCHRVVGKDGELHGYKWGLDRKRELIRRERGARKKKT